MKFKIFILSFSLILISCGKKDLDRKNEKTNVGMVNIKDQGIFFSVLNPINKSHTGNISSSATLVNMEDEFIAHVRFSNGSIEVLHQQNLHIGSRCPDSSDDLNMDGYIDAEEGSKIYKKILIPLDDDINSQRVGAGIFPVTNKFGQYFWSRTASAKKLMSDLYDADINSTDAYLKLKQNEIFNLKDKVVVISGIDQSHPLPNTVKGLPKISLHQSLPVACGVLKKLTHVPGKIDHDHTDIPLPNEIEDQRLTERDDGAIFNNSKPKKPENYGDENGYVLPHRGPEL